MKILLLSRKYTGIDGHSTVMNNVAHALLKKKIDVTIGAQIFLQNPPEDIPKMSLTLKDAFRFKKISASFDIIHNFQGLSNYLALFTSRPFIFHYLGTGTKLQILNLKVANLVVRRFVKMYFASSKMSANDLFDLIHVNAEIIPLAIDPIFFRNSNFPNKIEKPRLLTVTRMIQYKRNDELMYGFKKLLETYPDAHLDIIGDGQQFDQIKSLIKKLGIDEKVELLGRITHSDIVDKYASCDIFISTSSKEAFPLPVLECMAQGKPIVISDIPIHNEIVMNSNGGESYKSGNPEDLTNKIILVFQKRHEFGLNAKEYARKWNLENLGISLINKYDKILIR